MLLGLIALLATPSLVASQGTSGPQSCVRQCHSDSSGYYPDCDDCAVFHVCIGSRMFNLTCGPTLLYDSVRGLCDHPDTVTCGVGEADSPPAAFPPWDDVQSVSRNQGSPPTGTRSATSHACITSCTGVQDGDYQSCGGCDVYASCTAGYLTDSRPCPWSTFWDDVIKQCILNSTTCQDSRDVIHRVGEADSPPAAFPPWDAVQSASQNQGSPPTGSRSATSHACITSCTGVQDGDYQSCGGCDVYASCMAGYLTDSRPCPWSTFWDDVIKQCILNSTTCQHSRQRRSAPSRQRRHISPEDPQERTDGLVPKKEESFVYNRTTCIDSCVGLPSGLYSVCRDCNLRGYCFFGIPVFLECDPELEYDARVRRCIPFSSTCVRAGEGPRFLITAGETDVHFNAVTP